MKQRNSTLTALLLSLSLLPLAWGQNVAPQGRGVPRQPAADQPAEHPQGTNPGILNFTGHCAACHDGRKDETAPLTDIHSTSSHPSKSSRR
jgi:hypothetical protein